MDRLLAAYAADRWLTVAFVGAAPALSLILGPLLARLPRVAGRTLAWLQVLLLVGGVERLTLGCAGGFRMLAIIVALFTAMKVVVLVESPRRLTLARWLLWAVGWPGMRPGLFARPFKPDPTGWRFVTRGLVRIVCGLATIAAARLAYDHTASLLLTTALLLPGISMVLHFGVFEVVTGAWRLIGVRADTLFPAPLTSKTLGEFWGKRWNLPFTEMIQRAVYRPIAGVAGRDTAALAGFVCSGVLHELAISVPVRAGYGLPALYFVLHGALMLAERKLPALETRLRTTRLGHVWTLGWLALPLPILFHEPFLRGVVWPLIGV